MRTVAAVCGVLTASLLVAACGSPAASRHAAGATTTTALASAAPVSTAPPTTAATTSTTVDPGTLPQTTQLPSSSDPAFQARIADLWQAIVTGDTATAMPAFFPLSAYIQVKGISDPVHDYETRLIPDYDQDIETLHSDIASTAQPAQFQAVTVPNAAEWILPGVEYNKGSYWRVYGTRVTFLVGGQVHYFTIASMISWRGEWYVVHLLSIR